MKEMLGGCCVCSDENGWAGNPLVYCDGPECEVAVHQGCYGILEVPEGEWLCAKCHMAERMNGRVGHRNVNGSVTGGGEKNESQPFHPRCELCPFGYGALKRTDKNGWAHVICALYIPEVRFGDVHSMDPVILNDVPQERFEKKCYLCEDEGAPKAARVGACMDCNRNGCKKSFHVTCAQRRGLLCEEGGVSKNVKYCGYCAHHLKKAQNGPCIKIVPPCKVRPLATSKTDTSIGHLSEIVDKTKLSSLSNHSFVGGTTPKREETKMMIDQLPRPEPAAASRVLGGGSDSLLQSSGSTTFSPPLTSSSRSSLANEGATPPLKESTLNGQSTLHQSIPSTSTDSPSSLPPTIPSTCSPSDLICSPSTITSTLLNGSSPLTGVSSTSSSHLTNHNRLDVPSPTPCLARLNGTSSSLPPPLNHHHHNVHPSVSGNVPVGAAIAAGLVTPKGGTTVTTTTKRGAKSAELDGNKAKRCRNTKASHNSVRALLDAVEPLISETVSDFQRERVADKAAAAERNRIAASQLAAESAFALGSQQKNNAILTHRTSENDMKGGLDSLSSIPSTSSLMDTSLSLGGVPSGVPSTMQELLERQWEQGSSFLITNSHFDVAQLLHCLHSLKKENGRLEEQLLQLSKRRDHLLALNARLAMPLGATAAQAATQHGSMTTSGSIGVPLVSPHGSNGSPHIGGMPSMGVSCVSNDDSLSQLRSLACGGRASTPHSTRPSTHNDTRMKTPLIRPSTTTSSFSTANSLCQSVSTVASPSFGQSLSTLSTHPSSTTPTSSSGELERLASMLASSGSLSSLVNSPGARQQLVTPNGGVDPLFSLLMSSQNNFLNSQSTANLLRMFMSGSGTGGTSTPLAK